MAKNRSIARQEMSKAYSAHLLSHGEVNVYDGLILRRVIRRKELQIISEITSEERCMTILDCGCGPGWLSKFLSEKGLRVVGIEINSSLLIHARNVASKSSFVVCDAHVLPFKNETYDCIIGISTLHHLELRSAIREMKRVARNGSQLLFMEPNPLNFLSAFGRRFFPTEAHTVSEKPFLSHHLVELLKMSGVKDIEVSYVMFFSFPLARLYTILGREPSAFAVRLIGLIEKFTERFSILRKMNSTTVVRGVVRFK